MVKSRTQFVCQNCGATTTKWTGKCENCGEWNTLVEQAPVSSGKSAVAKSASSGHILSPRTMQSIDTDAHSMRLSTGIDDLDVVLGDGILPGGVVLLAGQPGIGKSTLLLQVTAHIAQSQPVLYASGEESASQVKLRAERLGANKSEQLSFVASTSADDIAATIRSGQYKLVIIDSIQTLSLDEITSAPGSVSQITNSSNVVIRAAKEKRARVFVNEDQQSIAIGRGGQNVRLASRLTGYELDIETALAEKPAEPKPKKNIEDSLMNAVEESSDE